ncbi:xanthine dehydrogenase family protein molybdopterin-binding subunit [Adlercreutzia sp. ZJ138]|uniref:xanthine dehydrogenase family protein molybdopterin-binding subunit n=1 Tax=Adlercreutzia sp. ZJ138 TaxID=2709405 RepID=UPI0013EDABA3|nr:molybdopterin cofactor-binding domain-containing protein [Adlercreutzia sp. ZJ138]
MADGFKYVGKSPQRRDAVDKVTGAARFTCDVEMPGMLHGKILRSTVPHAMITSIDTSAAESLKGVRAVLTHENTIDTVFNTAASMMAIPEGHHCIMDQTIFTDHIRFIGDEIAAVAADTEEIAEEACKLIKVEYEELPFVLDALEAEKEDAPIIHPENLEEQSARNVPGTPAVFDKGDIEAGFAEADKTVEISMVIHPVKQQQMETMGAVASVDGSGKITVYSTTQTTHVARNQIAHVFKVPASQVRVMNGPYVGGGFGSRIGLSSKAEVIAVALAMAARKPVRVVFSREEEMTATDTRHGGYVHIKLGAKNDGTLTAMDMSAKLNKGAYYSFGAEIFGTLGIMNTTRYRCPNIHFVGYSIYTNTTTAGAYRGFGNPQGNMTVERAMDMMAKELGMDPLDFRLQNATQIGDDTLFPYSVDSSTVHDCMRLGAERIDWKKKREELATQSGKIRRGLGMGMGCHFSGSWPYIVDYENAMVSLQPDGSLNVHTAATDLGTGCNTALAQICAEVMGMPYENVRINGADTDANPFGYGAHSTRTVYAHGRAAAEAIKDLKRDMFDWLAEKFVLNADEMTLSDGIITLAHGKKGFPAIMRQRQLYPEMQSTVGPEEPLLNSVTLTEVAHYAHSNNQAFMGKGSVRIYNAPPWFADFIDLSVDTETGKIVINEAIGVHDVGNVIHRTNVEGQIFGGLLQGIGYGTTEEILYDDKGRQAHRTMHHYMAPTALDVPDVFEAHTVEAPDPHGPLGCKGVGETPIIAPAGAILNAVSNALGIEFNEIPLTPEHILKRIKEEGKVYE